ncbi:MAG: class I SAM-dependent methyltransferase [Caulobacteraceae bacterium]|nr:class I SAM-dependent methyltransferase [Caulobacteraceae bacterium]
MEARETFEDVAELYGEVRQGYPAALFDDLIAMGALGPASRVLEVGCGAGQATGDLARRAGGVMALDPGAQLIEAAKARVSAANARFVVSGFEDFAVEPGGFDLVASAQAWHWIAPQAAFPKAALALAEDGWLAVFGHVPLPPPAAVAPAFERAFAEHAPGVWGRPPPQAWYLPGGPVAGLFEASGLFGPVAHRGYGWRWRVNAETFGKYLRTDSSYRALAEAPRMALFDALAAAVAAAEGGEVSLGWETHLYAARRG